MKCARSILVTGLAVLLCATTYSQDKDAVKPDTVRLQGAWTLVSGERDGEPFPAEFLSGSTRIVKDDETTVMIQGTMFMKAKFTVDPAKTPKTIDYSLIAGTYAGTRELGIYEFEGDKIKYCLATPGKPRPTGFSTAPHDGRTLTVWQPDKK